MHPLPHTDHSSTIRKLAPLLALLLTLLQPPAVRAVEQPTLSGFARSTLEIRSQGGRHWLKIWLAQSNEQQMQGLMFVRELPADEGMLFPLETPRIMTMWMKNTLIPLDMLFIDSHGRIVCLLADAKPESLELLSCDKPVKAVLEIGGGEAQRRGIRVGDTVVHATFHK